MNKQLTKSTKSILFSKSENVIFLIFSDCKKQIVIVFFLVMKFLFWEWKLSSTINWPANWIYLTSHKTYKITYVELRMYFNISN